MPAKTPARTPVRGRKTGIFPPFPAGLIPRNRGHRGGFSIGRFVYFGSHPVLTLIGLAVNLYLLALALAWIAVVTLGWLLCGAAVAMWRLVAKPSRQ